MTQNPRTLLNMQAPWIAPSILSADFARLGAEVDAVLAAGADLIHFDVMDNHYVPNLTIGPLVCEALRKHGVAAPIDVHLMIRPVDRIVPDFAAAGATYITFHPEASDHIDRTIELIREHGCKPGLVFNPATPLEYLDYTLEKLDLVLIMSVNPGFGGQKFIPTALRKLADARRRIETLTRRVNRAMRSLSPQLSFADLELQRQGLQLDPTLRAISGYTKDGDKVEWIR